MMQERAARTRSALIQAAALEFERRGYEGASLARISEAAHTSMGALTFHFRTKAALAEAVCSAYQQSMARHIGEALASTEAPLVALGGMVTSLLRLLETSSVAGAAARLRGERPGTGPAHHLAGPEWPVVLGVLLARAQSAGDLRAGVAPRAAEALVLRLVEGTGIAVRGRTRYAEGDPGGPSAEQVWELLRHAIARRTRG
ncbi:TetR family transcriptional regulator [Streptomyces sp. NPDC102402]|uniref:TetR family transcriptional regulator n=1 Tax=Streptomyces sp. NPDC102402 TaxID=3366169 RepID=UPI00382E00B1